MRARLAILVALSLLAAACGGNTEATSTQGLATAQPPTGAPSATNTSSGAPATNPSASGVSATPTPGQSPDLYLIDPGSTHTTAQPPAGPTTYGEVVDAGIAAGRWDELHGLELVLGYALGAVPSDQVPGVDSVQTGELNELLQRANSLAMSGQYSDEQLAGLRRWYALAVPGPDVMQALAGSARRVNGVTRTPAGAVLAAALSPGGHSQANGAAPDCVPVDPAAFSTWGDYESCYLMYEDSVEGVTLRVFYPAWFEGDPTVADLPLRARDALVRSAQTYSKFAPIGDVDLIFSQTDPAGHDALAVADSDATFGYASRGAACPITIFPSATISESDPFEGTVAHEAWHCVQRESGYPRGVAPGQAWYVEGGADYFANLVSPITFWWWKFDDKSTHVPLFDMSYEAAVWWQFLGNRDSPKAVADFMKQMALDGDGGHSAMKGYGTIFHQFVIDYVAGVITLPQGGTLPAATHASQLTETVSKDDKGRDIKADVNPFVAVRLGVHYQQQLRVLESDESTADVDVGMVERAQRSEPRAWAGVFPEVRSKCNQDAKYVVVATTEKIQTSASTPIHVDDIQQASCDPCLLGTWDLDLNSFQSMLTGAMAGSLPKGASLSGHYYISFDDAGAYQEQRDKLTIFSSFSGFSMKTVIDGFAHGTYTADGQNVTVSDLTDDYVKVTTGGQTFAEGSQILNGAGTYACGTDDLTLTVGSYEPVHWTGVDKILQPPADKSGK